MQKVGAEVKILTEVSDGQGDAQSKWIDGTVVNRTDVPMGMRAYGNRPGIIVHAPECAYKDKYIVVSDDMIGWVIS